MNCIAAYEIILNRRSTIFLQNAGEKVMAPFIIIIGGAPARGSLFKKSLKIRAKQWKNL